MKDQLEALIAQLVDRGVPFPAALGEFENKFIRRVLDQAHGNQSRAARLLGMHRNTLSRKMEEHKIEVLPSNGGRR